MRVSLRPAASQTAEGWAPVDWRLVEENDSHWRANVPHLKIEIWGTRLLQPTLRKGAKDGAPVDWRLVEENDSHWRANVTHLKIEIWGTRLVGLRPAASGSGGKDGGPGFLGWVEISWSDAGLYVAYTT